MVQAPGRCSRLRGHYSLHALSEEGRGLLPGFYRTAPDETGRDRRLGALERRPGSTERTQPDPAGRQWIPVVDLENR